MSSPFVAEIRMFAGNFAPTGWAMCNGQLMPISQNTALFSLLGTTYGGDGRATFALPNLQGLSPLNAGQGPGLSLRDLGEAGGEPNVTVLQTEMPAHNHALQGSSAAADAANPANKAFADGRWVAGNSRGQMATYVPPTLNLTSLNPLPMTPTGGSQPHNNLMPYLAVTFIIALQGVFPARS